ncbi:MogA/MoaB family molybdenum cofactor biosynthesis protein [Mediterraneibacter agrestimuris]|uniref:MogA/MoaB family molybdenum cofactor biosynthesis protein n=1 Tax=Mediterraneibacter agrestimuris TaxID=2941333 RepID=UPI00203C4A8D|nr:molybdopterin-binding protein [Mediterraneibacter agrestimuris]
MKAAIFTINTKLYQEKKDSPATVVLKRILGQAGLEVRAGALPEERDVISAVMKQLAENHSVQLILTVGANGFQKQDCAPDALCDAVERLLPGIPEAMRAYHMRSSRKMVLDCSRAGICENTLIVNLPGNSKLAKEGLEYVLPEIMQVVEALNL